MKAGVKFSTLENNQDFQMPDYVKGFEVPYIKLSECTYADKITKQCYWADQDSMIVNVITDENETKSEKKE